MRRAGASAVAAVVALVLIGCGGDAGQTVELAMASKVVGSTIVVEGTTDLPDGARIVYEVTHESFGTSDDFQDVTWGLFADGSVPVEDGGYAFTVPVAGWPAGDVTVWTAFQPDIGEDVDPEHGQPAVVMERYGEMGKHLTGSNVSESSGLKRVELERTVTLP